MAKECKIVVVDDHTLFRKDVYKRQVPVPAQPRLQSALCAQHYRRGAFGERCRRGRGQMCIRDSRVCHLVEHFRRMDFGGIAQDGVVAYRHRDAARFAVTLSLIHIFPPLSDRIRLPARRTVSFYSRPAVTNYRLPVRSHRKKWPRISFRQPTRSIRPAPVSYTHLVPSEVISACRNDGAFMM